MGQGPGGQSEEITRLLGRWPRLLPGLYFRQQACEI
jgi:hypothetical protein